MCVNLFLFSETVTELKLTYGLLWGNIWGHWRNTEILICNAPNSYFMQQPFQCLVTWGHNRNGVFVSCYSNHIHRYFLEIFKLLLLFIDFVSNSDQISWWSIRGWQDFQALVWSSEGDTDRCRQFWDPVPFRPWCKDKGCDAWRLFPHSKSFLCDSDFGWSLQKHLETTWKTVQLKISLVRDMRTECNHIAS